MRLRSVFCGFATAALTTGLLASSAHAQYSTAYSTFGSYTGQYLSQTVATTTTTGVTQTALYADDFTVASGFAGRTITQVSFALVNTSATAYTARLRYRIFDTTSTNPSGGPGVYQQVGYSPLLTLTPGLNQIVYNATGTLSTTIPTSGSGWFGLFFDNGGGATATATDIAGIGLALYGTPTVGTSTNRLFTSTAATGAFTANNPAGTITTNAAGSNFGLVLQVSSAPEPGTLALLFPIGGTAAAAGLVRARRRKQ